MLKAVAKAKAQNTDMTTLQVTWRFRERKRSTRTPKRAVAEHPDRLHRGFTEDSQSTLRGLTES